MNIVIYARYSSHSQTEQSIEGQLQTCYEYAKQNGHAVVGEYIDRAQSGTTDSRLEFQRMIADSDKHTFEGVLVYQLDRFARNRYDSAINKAKLKKNGARVLSARENISEDASGILVEGVLESMAEYYSAELSQKIRRGMNINAEKCLSNGSNPGLGYRIDEERRFHVDPVTAPIVREIFERYTSGEMVSDIIKDLNARQIRTSIGKDFNKNSLHRLLRNRRYIGYYIYKNTETPDGMPRIIEDELFQRAQHILGRNKQAPARSRGKMEYLLTTKLFCGYCKELMTGYGGTGKSGKNYFYYACNNYKRHKCKKKVVSKQAIEDRVILECRKLLTESNIEKIAQSVAAACDADFDSSAVKRLKAALQEANTAIENLWKALESGQSVEMITGRIEKRQKEKEELQAQIAIEMNKQVVFTAPQISAFLYALKKGGINDEHNRKGIINIFLRAVYLWDDKFTLILNGGDRPIEIDGSLLDEIEADNAACGCSSLVADAPPQHLTYEPLDCKSSYVKCNAPPN
ncbi:recombinase family protein [Oscillibacter sp.]|uniref:recombinase family protein n=1 Tax=Oscillibacter sp. TaxID=1945593 RepID=UPI0028A7BDBB|nr:recombinase family protein [Oscillibacter sp.]